MIFYFWAIFEIYYILLAESNSWNGFEWIFSVFLALLFMCFINYIFLITKANIIRPYYIFSFFSKSKIIFNGIFSNRLNVSWYFIIWQYVIPFESLEMKKPGVFLCEPQCFVLWLWLYCGAHLFQIFLDMEDNGADGHSLNVYPLKTKA